jgi:hypothetical protein
MDIGFAGLNQCYASSSNLLLHMRLTICRLCAALTVELLLNFFLDNIPAFFCVRHNALGAVLHSCGKSGIDTRAIKEEEWTVAKKA